MEIYKKIGALIRAKRIELKLSQKRLAVSVGMSRTSLINAEAGTHRLPLHIAYKLSQILQIPFESFLNIINE